MMRLSFPVGVRCGVFLLSIFLSRMAAVSAAEPPAYSHLFPAGGQRGESVTTTLHGDAGEGDLHFWCDSGQLQGTVSDDRQKLTVDIPENADPGVHWIRLYAASGSTAPLPFVVGGIPERIEQEDNNTPDQATVIDLPTATVNGVLERRGDVDVFRVQVPAGRTLVASLQAHRDLGSPMDAVLQILDERGAVIAQNDDDHGLDPQIVLENAGGGEGQTYFIRTFAFPAQPNSSIHLAGAPSYVYRLTVTSGPFIDHVFPSVVDCRSDSAVTVYGWNLTEESRTASVPKCDDLWTFVSGRWALSHPIRGVLHASMVETDASRVLASSGSVTGRIARPGERDVYTITGIPGQSVRVQVTARAIHSLLDPVLVVTGADGRVLKEVDDRSRTDQDADITVALPENGRMTATVTDRFDAGGFRYFYVLTCEPSVPGFQAFLTDAQYVIDGTKPTDIPVTIERMAGFSERLQVSVDGLPPGVQADPVVSEKEGDSAKAVTLRVTASSEAVPFSGTIHIMCGAEESEMRKPATVTLGNSGRSTADVWLTVIPPVREESIQENDSVQDEPDANDS